LKAPSLKAPALKAPPLPGSAPKAPSAPAAELAASGGADHPPTQLKASGPMPAALLAANRDKPSGPPQPYVPSHQR